MAIDSMMAVVDSTSTRLPPREQSSVKGWGVRDALLHVVSPVVGRMPEGANYLRRCRLVMTRRSPSGMRAARRTDFSAPCNAEGARLRFSQAAAEIFSFADDSPASMLAINRNSTGGEMLVMHYRIALGGDAVEVATAIRKRVAERGPVFEGMTGLERKFFLLDPLQPTYATLYLWRDPDAALAFLQGPFFAALSRSFGRPEVRLLLSTAIELPPTLPKTVVLSDAQWSSSPAHASRLSTRATAVTLR
jgi:hypothetical protein